MYETRKVFFFFFEKEGMGEKEINRGINRWSQRQRRVMKDEERKKL